ncbi:interaptin-like isoform X1 [Pararge aegeria]|uniref:E3 ubiquitin-protein ligase CHFR n=5 Tax=Pararge aegeria TaxID=116150 RepID=A0A8S4RDN2_9NEOP|nr:interaptin-like isoform X1 [Pararge aegeria]CAH2233887.1 jg18192 [Pararge aegeria aegeria]
MQQTFPKLKSCKLLKSPFKSFQKVDVVSEEFTIGRGLENKLIIPFGTISRNHCKLFKNDKKWFLEDYSTFGININGVNLGKGNSAEINHNDVIVLDETYAFVYQFLNKGAKNAELAGSSAKRIKLEQEENSADILIANEMMNNAKVKFEKSQDCEIRHIENKIESAKQIKTKNMILKNQLQLDMKRKIKSLESNFAAKIENLKGGKNEVKMQKAMLIIKRDSQLATLKQDMEAKISELLEQINKHNEIESELIVENNLLKEKLLRERDEFLLELNRENSLKQDIMKKLETQMKEQEDVRLKEKQEFESLLQMEREKLRLSKEKELNAIVEQKRKRELELTGKLKLIKVNLQEQEKQKLEVQRQFKYQLEAIKKVKDEDKQKMEQLMHTKLSEAEKNAQKKIETLKTTISERETELSAIAAERIQKQAQQSSEVISSLQDQLERVRSQLKNVESENVKLIQNATSNTSEVGNTIQTLTEVGNIMESELQCSICAELFVDATTLNCSHTFCKYCITTWMKKKRECPICRKDITSECRSLVLDSFIEKMVQNLTHEMKEKRKIMLKAREDEVTHMNTKTLGMIPIGLDTLMTEPLRSIYDMIAPTRLRLSMSPTPPNEIPTYDLTSPTNQVLGPHGEIIVPRYQRRRRRPRSSVHYASISRQHDRLASAYHEPFYDF